MTLKNANALQDSLTYSAQLMSEMDLYSAHNYSPLPVVLARGEGAWVWDVEGERYLDMLSGYSALNFGHVHPRLTARAIEQLNRLTLTSRAFHAEELVLCCKELAQFCGLDKVLLMNSGAEAVETAIKAARRWAYRVKKVEQDKATVVCFNGNFHGRTTTIISSSDSADSRSDFGPFTPGFVLVPYNDLAALERVLDDTTAAILVEPIQGEGGIIIPSDGYLPGLRRICDEHKILLITDEIQTGLCRTGKRFAAEYDSVEPDLLIIGKSLGGGIVPISAVAGRAAVMDVFEPGSHGSTFGGNPFACAIAREVIKLIEEEKPEERARVFGDQVVERLRALKSPLVKEIRGRGLLIGIEFTREAGAAKDFSKLLLKRGLLTKDTRKYTLRLAPPLTIDEADLDWAVSQIEEVLAR